MRTRALSHTRQVDLRKDDDAAEAPIVHNISQVGRAVHVQRRVRGRVAQDGQRRNVQWPALVVREVLQAKKARRAPQLAITSDVATLGREEGHKFMSIQARRARRNESVARPRPSPHNMHGVHFEVRHHVNRLLDGRRMQKVPRSVEQ